MMSWHLINNSGEAILKYCGILMSWHLINNSGEAILNQQKLPDNREYIKIQEWL
jgi:hypothetical protein